MLATRLLCAALLYAGTASLAVADETSETIDEITVLGIRDLGALRAEITRAEDEVYELYNDLNEDDDYDIICRKHAPIGSQIKQRVCLAKLYRDALAEATTDEDQAMIAFGHMPNSKKHNARLRDNMSKLANKNPELVEALRKRYDLQQKFDQERQKTFGKNN